jgi:hypothetical protein
MAPEFSANVQSAIEASRALVRFRYPFWLRPLLLRGVVGITLGRRIYLAAGLPPDRRERFLRHELKHVEQINRHGLLGFYWRYVREYIANRRRGMPPAAAYRSISFEVEALAAEENV